MAPKRKAPVKRVPPGDSPGPESQETPSKKRNTRSVNSTPTNPPAAASAAGSSQQIFADDLSWPTTGPELKHGPLPDFLLNYLKNGSVCALASHSRLILTYI